MKLLGFLLLPSGWMIVLAAIALLRPGPSQPAFLFAGIGVEVLGLALLVRAHAMAHGNGK